jgi:glycolate oxidase FAD binding subunit|tara:strand:+ start:8279 stop:9271 length:993 start_codon:yes stop_codon:yes gene_type:complete
VGNHTKPPLSETSATLISTNGLSGIIEYDPSEYTFTAFAGTPLTEIHSALAEKGQYLPCAPLLRDAGATLGGSIASGLSGPERFRYGGLRDFLLGIQFIAGDGSLHRAGGQVVKNAAGFDLPKFFVGSLGRFGILTEVTFKVFPAPTNTLTLKTPCSSPEDALESIVLASASRWELNAIDYHPEHSSLYLQLGGPLSAIEIIAREIQSTFPDSIVHDESIWNSIRELTIFPRDTSIVKIPLTPKTIPSLQSSLSEIPDATAHYSVGGNLALLATSDLSELSTLLESRHLQGMTIQAPPGSSLWLGTSDSFAIHAALKSTLDPQKRFPPLS